MQSSTFCALLSGDKHIISILPAPNEALERTAHLAGFFRLFLVPSRVGRRSARALARKLEHTGGIKAMPDLEQVPFAGVCAVHAVMLGGESPLSRCTWRRRTREAQGRLREEASEGRVERTCGARDTNRIRGVVQSGRAGTRQQSPPSTWGCAVYIRRLCTDGMTAYHGRSPRRLGMWRATEIG